MPLLWKKIEFINDSEKLFENFMEGRGNKMK